MEWPDRSVRAASAPTRWQKRASLPDRVIDPNELRFKRHRLVRRNIVTVTPLDTYRHAGFLTRRQYDAGERLRDIWHRAGRAPKMTTDLELVGRGPAEMSDAQALAFEELAEMLKPLIPDHRALVHNVCCFEHGAESAAGNLGQPAHVGLMMLRDALDALSRVRASKRRKP